MVFVGVDWAEAHHDVCLLDELGKVLGKRRIPDGLEGVRRLHELVCEHAEEPEQVVGIETDRGLLVRALLAAGYQVYAVNPLAVSRYRDRHTTSRAKSDAGDAKLLADLVRTDRHNHRPIAGDSELAGAIQVLARAHQNLVWSRQRHVNQLRNTLREFYPGALEAFSTDLAGVDAVTILERAPTPHRVAPSPRPRSSPRCAKPAVSATWSSRRPRSGATCGLPSWRSRSLTRSQGARRYYDQLRGRGKTHHQALRALANRLVSVLHGCITHRQPYREHVAWPAPEVAA